LRTVHRHGPIPIRHSHTGTNILKCLLKFVEINAVPGKKAFPPVLTMVLMNQCQVVITATILGPLIEMIEFAERPTKLLDLGLAHAIEIHSLFDLTFFETVFVWGSAKDCKSTSQFCDVFRTDLLNRGRGC